jgi:hypothetical protein
MLHPLRAPGTSNLWEGMMSGRLGTAHVQDGVDRTNGRNDRFPFNSGQQPVPGMGRYPVTAKHQNKRERPCACF